MKVQVSNCFDLVSRHRRFDIRVFPFEGRQAAWYKQKQENDRGNHFMLCADCGEESSAESPRGGGILLPRKLRTGAFFFSQLYFL